MERLQATGLRIRAGWAGAARPAQQWLPNPSSQQLGPSTSDVVWDQRRSRCLAAQPGSIPTSAPLASPAVRGSTSSDSWNGADVAELDAASPAQPIVDDLVWEVPGADPPRVAFSDLETVEIADPHGSGWGQWGGTAFRSNCSWSQQQWQVMPGELEPQENYDGTFDGTAPEGSASTAAVSPEPTASAQPAVMEVWENDPARYRFHSALFAAAMRGDPDEVSTILSDMVRGKLQPGPAAQHTLVFAHIKAGNAMEGLHAARESVKNGVIPLEETYVALVFGLVEEGFVESAEGVVMSMYNAGRDTRNGWLALTKGLFRKGLTDQAFQHLQKGLQEGWNPDASLYEHVLRAFCATGNVEQAQRVLASMADLGVPPRALHFNILVEAIARTSGLEAAVLFVQQGFPRPSAREGAFEPEQKARDVATTNTETFCAIFRGLMDPACSHPIESVTEYAQVSNLMQEMDVMPGPRIVALGLRRYLQDGELDLALHQVATLRSAAGDEWSEHVPEGDIVALLAGCGRAERPLDLAVLLRELVRRGRRLAGFALPTTVDSAGRSVTALTAWLPARVALAGTSESTLVGGLASEVLSKSGVSTYDGSLREEVVNGRSKGLKDIIYIGIGNCVVDERGHPLPIAKMRKPQIVAELEGRDSDTSGKIHELRSLLKLQRHILEPHIQAWFKQNEDDGGLMMSRVRALIASGTSMAEAMKQVQQSMKQQIEAPPKDDAAADEADLVEADTIPTLSDVTDKMEDEDEFGIPFSTEYQIVEYENWNQTRVVTVTYGEMDTDDRAAVRKLRKYERPARAGGSVASRREDALRGVVDDAQVTLERGEGWDDDDAAAEGGLLGQFEGEMLGDGDGDEMSLSDGVGTSEAQQRELADSAVGLMEDDEDVPSGLDGIGDTDGDEAVNVADATAEDDDLQESATEAADALQDDSGDLLDDEDLEDQATDALDLSGQTNESAGLEVAIECLRCSRVIGLVISNGDYEAALDCALTLGTPEIVLSLHGWALDQASELLVDVDSAEEAQIRAFTQEYVAKSRSTLKDMGHDDKIGALLMNEEEADFL